MFFRGFFLILFFVVAIAVRAELNIPTIDKVVSRFKLVNAPWLANVSTVDKGIEFSAKKQTPAKLKYYIRDWRNRVVGQGEWDTREKLYVTNLPVGYYAMFLYSNNKLVDQGIFGLVPKPDIQNNKGQFSIGCSAANAVNFKVGKRKLTRKDIAKTIALTGAVWYRDQSSWASINPKKGKYNWSRPDESFQTLSDAGLKLTVFDHSAPAYACRPKAPGRNYTGQTLRWTRWMPDNMFDYYEYNRIKAKRFSGLIDVWELGNEADLTSYNTRTMWDYSTMLKVGSLGVKAGNPRARVAHAAFWALRFPGRVEICYKNDITPFFDITNWHIYTTMEEYSHNLAAVNALRAKYRFAEKPFWFTEYSIKTSAVLGKPLGQKVNKHSEFDYNQDLYYAEFAVKSSLTLRAYGVDRGFFFRCMPINERADTDIFGLLRWNMTIKPVFVAYANLNTQLGKAEFLGKCKLVKGLTGYLYKQPDGSQTLVFWKNSPIDFMRTKQSAYAKTITDSINSVFNLNLSRKSSDLKLVDIMGSPQKIQPVSHNRVKLPVSNFPQYLHGLYNMRYQPESKVVNKSKFPVEKFNRNIVLKANFKDAQINNMASATLRKGDEFDIEVFNFSNETIKGKLKSLNRLKLQGIDQELTVAPMSSVLVKIKYPGGISTELCIGGVFNNKEVTRLAVPLSAMSRSNIRVIDLDYKNPKIWHKNATGNNMTITYDKKMDAILFDIDFSQLSFKNTSFNTYPKILAKDIYSGNPHDILGISYKIKTTPGAPPMRVSYTVLGGLFIPAKQPESSWLSVFSSYPTKKENIERARKSKFWSFGGSIVFPMDTPLNKRKYKFWIKDLKVIKRR